MHTWQNMHQNLRIVNYFKIWKLSWNDNKKISCNNKNQNYELSLEIQNLDKISNYNFCLQNFYFV